MKSFYVALILPFAALIVFSVVRYFSWLIYRFIPRSWRETLYTDYATGRYSGPVDRQARD